jgi:hypothetical protein
MHQHPVLDSKTAYDMVEELEAVPYARAPGSRAYLPMARKLLEICRGDEKTTPYEQARWVIDKALLWEEWRGPAGLVNLFNSRFAPSLSQPVQRAHGKIPNNTSSNRDTTGQNHKRPRTRTNQHLQQELFGEPPSE